MLANQTSPYLMEEPPTSTGRVLLSRAFSHWCILHYGYSEHDVHVALDPDEVCDKADRRTIRWAARLLGELPCAEELRAFTRPIGGGNPAPLKASTWERDDFRMIFARSALDLARPFDDAAAPTHWIFLDEDEFDRLVQRSVGQAVIDVEQASTESVSRVVLSVHMQGDDHVRKPELERRTGMSRATIYRRIAEGRFP